MIATDNESDMENKIKVIITGATGMVGEGVMHECLENPAVEAVLIVNRKPSGCEHPKLKEIVHTDFFNFSAIENELNDYDACFFCLGISSIGVKPDEYFRMTHTLTLHVAQTLSRINPAMTFCYVSGAGTDSTEQGRSNWARVKGKTENDLVKLPFRKVFNFRPGFIKPTEGLKNMQFLYRYFGWLFPIGRALYPKGFCTLKELGLAMIYVAGRGYEKKVIEGDDIILIAAKQV
jgi:uncharacterized protein YbjT (DUF2867 family)